MKTLEGMKIQPQMKIELGPLSRAVRFHRKKAGLSQAELAKHSGIGKTAVFDLEKGKPTIQLDTLLKVLRVLNIEMCFQSPLMESYVRSTSRELTRKWK